MKALLALFRFADGPERVSIRLADLAEQHGVELECIQPGKPAQNS